MSRQLNGKLSNNANRAILTEFGLGTRNFLSSKEKKEERRLS